MPNGSEMLNDLEFDKQIKEMTDRGLMEFTARQLYEHCEESNIRDGKIKALEDRDKKFAGAVGGASGLLGAAIIAVLNYFTGKS